MSNPPETVPVTELLDHAGWIRALARRLARNPDDADDLVQEAWIAAMRNPPKRGGPVRPWLARVLGNLALSSRRSRARASDHVERAQEVSPPDGDGELVVQLERQRELASVVAELPEPYRSVVLARYYQGESTARTARRLGRSAATVRSQHARALELLRRRLETRYGSKSEAFSAIWIAAGRSTFEFVPNFLLGVLTLKASTKLAVAGAVLAALVATIFVTSDARLPLSARSTVAEVETPDAPPREPGATAALQDTEPDREPARASVPVQASPAVDSVPEVPAVSVVVARVVHERGFALSQARLAVHDGKQSAQGRSAPSGEDGHVRLELATSELLSYGSYGLADVVFAVQAPNCAMRFLRATPERGGELDLGDIVLAPGGSVSGLVLDDLGRAVDGAEVLVADVQLDQDVDSWIFTGPEIGLGLPPARSSIDGAFHVRGVPLGNVRVWARGAAGLWAFTEPVEVLESAETSGLVLELPSKSADRRITGRVIDAAGNALADARVHYSPMGRFIGEDFVECDDQGRFSVVPMSAQMHRLIGRDPEGHWRSTEVTANVGAEEVVIRLPEPVWLEISVVDEAGELIPHAHVDPNDHTFVRFVDYRQEPREPGRVAIPLPQAPFELNVSARGFGELEEGPFDPETVPLELSITLRRQPKISGRVLAGGEPLAGAQVSLLTLLKGRAIRHQGFNSRFIGPSMGGVTTDEAGRFSLPAPSDPKAVVLFAEKEGWSSNETEELGVFADGLEGIELVLTPGGAIEGYVRGLENPLGQLVMISRGDGFPQKARTDETGFYRFEHLTPGPWRVEHRVQEEPQTWTFVDPNETPRADWSCEVFEGRTTRHDVDLAQTELGRVVGTLKVDGAPASGWTASLDSSNPFEDTQTGRAVVLDNEGRFQLEAERGTYSLHLTSPLSGDGTVHLNQNVELAVGGPLDWARELQTGVVAGRVEGQPSQPLRFHGSADGLEVLVRFEPQQDGSFSVAGVPAGVGSIQRRVQSERRGPVWQDVERVELRPGGRVSVEVD